MTIDITVNLDESVVSATSTDNIDVTVAIDGEQIPSPSICDSVKTCLGIDPLGE